MVAVGCGWDHQAVAALGGRDSPFCSPQVKALGLTAYLGIWVERMIMAVRLGVCDLSLEPIQALDRHGFCRST